MPDNSLTLVGNLTRDIELRYTPKGRAVGSTGLAVNRRYQVNGEWQEHTSFFNLVVWGQPAEHAAQSLAKGTHVLVTGRLDQREYEASGEKRTAIEMVVDEIGPSMRWATAQVERVTRTSDPGGGTPDYGGDEEPF